MFIKENIKYECEKACFALLTSSRERSHRETWQEHVKGTFSIPDEQVTGICEMFQLMFVMESLFPTRTIFPAKLNGGKWL